ncbi:hypothetical protein EVAR_6663_1 [Eumeta japonica]|uniref:Uncharacterized protein n=1 Tax=Eumeta variegata TaxID=151549 RepID=A0A4C1TMU9_EUMVA|nr:hypothetical protein EVAR_6663_1 [Eumeta japonica]
MKADGWDWNSLTEQDILAGFGLIGIVLRCTLTMSDFRGVMIEPEIRHRNVGGFIGIVSRCTLTVSDIQGLTMDPEDSHLYFIIEQCIRIVFELVGIVLKYNKI